MSLLTKLENNTFLFIVIPLSFSRESRKGIEFRSKGINEGI